MAVIWGRNAVSEALKAGKEIERIYLAEGVSLTGPLAEIVRAARSRGIAIQRLDRRALDRIAKTEKHQGIIAEVGEFAYASLEQVLEAARQRQEPPLILILDTLQDPQNFGTLIRTADAVGAHGVVIPKHRAVGVTPAVVKASSGAIAHLLVARVTNLARAIDELKRQGVWVVGLDADAERSFDEVDLNMPIALVVGAEGRGISRLVKEKCDILIKIPMRGHVDSLNAAVAGSIVLYHAWRQRERR